MLLLLENDVPGIQIQKGSRFPCFLKEENQSYIEHPSDRQDQINNQKQPRQL